jgi:3-methyladenine DNA glycosylase AlkD
MSHPITCYIQNQLRTLHNPTNATAMAAYMKTTMPFYGVKAPERRAILKAARAQHPIENHQDYITIIHHLWNQPHREEKYCALDIARAYPRHMLLTDIHVFKTMICQGAWWDFVDEIAINMVGPLLTKNPDAYWPLVDAWIHDEHMWIRRTAIICQNKFKHKTDAQRLFAFCLARTHEKEFFIRKAIGWALREYAKTDPQAVRAFVTKHKEQLSALSYKEATKHF